MDLRILGVHNMESRETRLESHVIDDVLALDVGGLTRSLDFEEQRRLRAVILTHRHFDHVRDIVPLGLTLRNSSVTVNVYGIADTLHFVKDKLLDGTLYPNFLEYPSVENPVFKLREVELNKPFQVLDYTVTGASVPHAVPAAGYQIDSGDVKLFYTGDTGEGLDQAWQHVSPDVLLTEVTFGNDGVEYAIGAVHLTPQYLEDALVAFKDRHGYLPRVIVGHMNPPWEETIRQEVAAVRDRLGADIIVASADMRLTLP
ncbi:MAG: MBL fold metallo-hydrolase [SAR202 cluster bacterium]|jgi:glyoxylase-like metal-dependent hydrolase (beta-lactamase superfamily II)|nr:MBL fold metallo-hydrolase [SAR202 cluster bacterium]MDP7102571.1 MBL fold metallo-hydrolase [SAR202 cluster bacterium]MDP7413243.1 MBL fold metallo-hydrolase [SAR202 cluster bacterium]HJO82732.1 MBL fold metallo-hydrolase [SAR202 cluster bacterium]|tara:strand:+ start:8943 stop:9716 length:774 start_codon:yes stop_codon:yes gene_type:complete